MIYKRKTDAAIENTSNRRNKINNRNVTVVTKHKEEICMSKLVNKVRKFGFIAVCLSLVLGVMGVCGGAATASASSNAVIMQTIYTDGDEATLIAKVNKDQYEKYGATLVIVNSDETAEQYYAVPSYIRSGRWNFTDGNYATVEYSYGEGCYVVTFKVNKSTIPAGARAYFKSGLEVANNGGYNYYIFG